MSGIQCNAANVNRFKAVGQTSHVKRHSVQPQGQQPPGVTASGAPNQQSYNIRPGGMSLIG